MTETTSRRNNMKRTDVHRPSALDPADYTLVGSFDAHGEDGYFELDEQYSDLEWSGVRADRGRCDHCGVSIRYGVIFLHEPTQTLMATGTICAQTLNLNSLSEKAIKEKAEYRRILNAIERWKAERPENAEAAAYFEARAQDDADYRDAMERWNDDYEIALLAADYDHKAAERAVGPTPKPKYRYNEFVSDVARKLRRYGSLSEAQVNAVLKVKARDEEFAAKREAEAAKLADAPPLAEGRYEITGEVVSTKWVDGYMTDYRGNPVQTFKMLVKMADGNKVFGTVPSSLSIIPAAGGIGTRSIERGDRVTFTAKVERSRDDEHFGFFSRPTKASVEAA